MSLKISTIALAAFSTYAIAILVTLLAPVYASLDQQPTYSFQGEGTIILSSHLAHLVVDFDTSRIRQVIIDMS